MTITQMLHDLGQRLYSLEFSEDFEGMITVTVYRGFEHKYVRHTHVGYPGCPMDKLDVELRETLAQWLVEANADGVIKDGLADE